MTKKLCFFIDEFKQSVAQDEIIAGVQFPVHLNLTFIQHPK